MCRKDKDCPTGEGSFANITVMSMYSRDQRLIDTMALRTRILDRIVGSLLFYVDVISHDSRNNLFVYYPTSRLSNYKLGVYIDDRYISQDTLYAFDDYPLPSLCLFHPAHQIIG